MSIKQMEEFQTSLHLSYCLTLRTPNMLRAIPRMTSSVHVNILTSLDRNHQYASSASDVIPNTSKVIPFATITLPGSVILGLRPFHVLLRRSRRQQPLSHHIPLRLHLFLLASCSMFQPQKHPCHESYASRNRHCLSGGRMCHRACKFRCCIIYHM